jgi:hypothetical protein
VSIPTRRRRNLIIWAGFAVVLLGAFSYLPLFANMAITRDIPWANFLLFIAGVVMIAVGLKRAYGAPDAYRGRISGSILGVLSLLSIGLFSYGVFVLTKVPSPQGPPKPGDPAPRFTLANTEGAQVGLADLLKDRRAALLIFYRGSW